MTKEKSTLTYFEKLVDTLKEAAIDKGYEGTPTMDRLLETLQRIQNKEQALLAKGAPEAMVKYPKSEEISTKFQDLVGKKAPAEKHVDTILAQANAKGAITLGK